MIGSSLRNDSSGGLKEDPKKELERFVVPVLFLGLFVFSAAAHAGWDWTDEKSKRQQLHAPKPQVQASVVTEVAPVKPPPPPVVKLPAAPPPPRPAEAPHAAHSSAPAPTSKPTASSVRAQSAAPPVTVAKPTPAEAKPHEGAEPSVDAKPPEKIKPDEAKTLLTEFVRAQNTELQALVHREMIDETARDDEERARKNEYFAREKRKHAEFFAKEKSSEKRRAFEAEEKKAREEFLAKLTSEMTARKKSFSDQKSVLQNSHRESLAKFKSHLSRGERPPVSLWRK